MMRPLGTWIALFACLALPALAAAQDSDDDVDESIDTNNEGGLFVSLRVNNEPVNVRDPDPLGKRACDDNVPLAFEITGFGTLDQSTRLIAIWVGNNCNNGDYRDRVESTDCRPITEVERIESSTEQTVTIMMADLCEETGKFDVYFLPLDSPSSNEDVSVYGVYEIEIDVDPPKPPTNVRAQAGETEIPVEWDPGDSNILQNWLVWDIDPIGADDLADSGVDASAIDGCASAKLIAGEDFDVQNPPDGTKLAKVGDVRSHKLNGTTLGAKRVALGILSEDEAGNLSVLSSITCVSVVPTDGFWDAYQGAGGDIEQGCACSLPGATPRNTSLRFLPLGLAVALVVVRSRRRRRS